MSGMSFPASSITRAICASWSAGAPITLRLMGAEQHTLFKQAHDETPGFAFVVRSMQIDFLKPARMDDVLDVVTWPVAVRSASITLAQVRRDDQLLVKAEVRVAFISGVAHSRSRNHCAS
jgi:acyl-CoA thioesterase FadM